MTIGTIFLARILYEDTEERTKHEEYRLVRAEDHETARGKVWAFYHQVEEFKPISVVILEDIL